ncbi:MFS transporter [Sabulicella glaciei]|uniref:MFS transporter n=1 Tax=Sabulicella glaciei TaxID=2984948 RepID=A0ABT3NWU5_9PROT|nr:MFS transporter [Roseococcus sp. MDT2-1-1]MCW8086635.1 MFS transporter [Roseococcus sp. MDT2-1-1]
MTPEERGMRRTVWRLFFCQALLNTTLVGQVSMAALIGHSLSTDKSLATLPMAVQMTAVMAASIPASLIFARWGRRTGFLLGAMLSLLGSITFAAGVWMGDFVVYCTGAVFAGLGIGIGQHYRFAAAEAATPEYRPRAIALVMAGPVLSAIFGPEIVKHTHAAFAPTLFLGTYLVLAVLPVLCLLLLTGLRLPPLPPRGAGRTPLLEIMRRPQFISAAAAGMVSYGAMNLAMTATPLEMMLCGFGVASSATVIQFHAVSMFAPGFFTGHLIVRFGVRRIIAVGAALIAASVLVSVAGKEFWHFATGLALLGLGWNFMFVGATNLLGTAHRPEERVKAQAANDFLVFGTVAATAFLSGFVHARLGWEALNLLLLPALAGAVALIAWQAARVRPAPAAA